MRSSPQVHGRTFLTLTDEEKEPHQRKLWLQDIKSDFWLTVQWTPIHPSKPNPFIQSFRYPFVMDICCSAPLFSWWEASSSQLFREEKLTFSLPSPLFSLQEWSCDQSLVTCDQFKNKYITKPIQLESALGFLWDCKGRSAFFVLGCWARVQ